MADDLFNSFMNGPDDKGRFGDFGGRFVSETLMPLILELEQQYEIATIGKESAQLDQLCQYCGIMKETTGEIETHIELEHEIKHYEDLHKHPAKRPRFSICEKYDAVRKW